MKRSMTACLCASLALAAGSTRADSTPDVLHYVFNNTGTSVTNLASNPPPGTTSATIRGGLTQTGADLNYADNGHSLRGSGGRSDVDFLDTGWTMDLTGAWTISFVAANFTPSTTVYYVFGDDTADSFRCFTNGVTGPNNWILRGHTVPDVYVAGGATLAAHRITYVYDYDADRVRGYLDGVQVDSAPLDGKSTLIGHASFKVMGYADAAHSGPPPGALLDDFRVYRRALSDREIAEIDAYAIVEVRGNAMIIADGDSTPTTSDFTDFGGAGTNVHETVTRAFTISNKGNLDLSIGAITIGGANSADFTVTTEPKSPIAPGGGSSFEITFDPSADGLRRATLGFTTNDPSSNSFGFSVQGTGLDVIFRDNFEG